MYEYLINALAFSTLTFVVQVVLVWYSICRVFGKPTTHIDVTTGL